MARLGGGERDLGALRVPDLTHEDYVRVLAQDAPQRPGEGLRVRPDLALVYEASDVTVQELYRVLDGDDVLALGAVDEVYHGGKRR